MRQLFTKNVFFSAVSNVADLLQFILTILAARLLTKDSFEILNYAMAVSMVFMAFSDLGLNYLLIRDISRDRALTPRYVRNIVTWKIPLAVVAFGILLAAFCFPNPDPPARATLAILGAAMMVRSFSLTIRSFFQGMERFDLESIGVVIEQILLVGGGCVLLLAGGDVVSVAWLFLATRMVGFLFTFSLLRRVTPVRLGLEPNFLIRLQREALPIGIAFGVLMAYVQIDTIILDHLCARPQVADFNAAFSIYRGFFIIPNIIGIVSLPRLSDAFQRDRPLFRKLLGQNARSIALLSLLVASVGMPASRWLVGLLYPETYAGAALPLQILFLALVITSQNWLLRLVLIAMNRQAAFMGIYIFGLLVRAGADILLIVRFGIVGAAVATLLAEGILFGVMWAVILAGARRARVAGAHRGHEGRNESF
ncbi:MAG: flippase [Verrucomicrobiota bacterium]|nr:flippase [Verrucomicrobiota bacterium]